jgi:hypothetical protein
MNENCMDRLAFIVPDYESALKLRDELIELTLFDRLSFNIELENYWIYLKSVSADKIKDLKKIVDNNRYRLVRYRI